MAKGNPNQSKSNAPTWRFRVRGESRDGEMVTLGRYETEKEATAHYDALVENGNYQHLKVQPLKPKPTDSGG